MDAMVGPNYWFVTVAPVGGEAELVLNLAQGVNGELGDDTGISLTVANIEETHQSLTDKGVTFMKPIEAMPWGAKATWLEDPDGNTFFSSKANVRIPWEPSETGWCNDAPARLVLR